MWYCHESLGREFNFIFNICQYYIFSLIRGNLAQIEFNSGLHGKMSVCSKINNFPTPLDPKIALDLK